MISGANAKTSRQRSWIGWIKPRLFSTIDWPRAETKTDWIFMGYDEDLNEAMKIAVRETINFLATQTIVPMNRDEAYALASMAADCRVSQVVDIRKGVHCMVPKSIFVKK